MDTNKELAPKGKFAQLTLDFPFKKTFASEGGENVLIALLNAFLEKKLAHPITQVVIQNPLTSQISIRSISLIMTFVLARVTIVWYSIFAYAMKNSQR